MLSANILYNVKSFLENKNYTLFLCIFANIHMNGYNKGVRLLTDHG